MLGRVLLREPKPMAKSMKIKNIKNLFTSQQKSNEKLFCWDVMCANDCSQHIMCKIYYTKPIKHLWPMAVSSWEVSLLPLPTWDCNSAATTGLHLYNRYFIDPFGLSSLLLPTVFFAVLAGHLLLSVDGICP